MSAMESAADDLKGPADVRVGSDSAVARPADTSGFASSEATCQTARNVAPVVSQPVV
jgi:hypothetical protein